MLGNIDHPLWHGCANLTPICQSSVKVRSGMAMLFNMDQHEEQIHSRRLYMLISRAHFTGLCSSQDAVHANVKHLLYRTVLKQISDKMLVHA